MNRWNSALRQPRSRPSRALQIRCHPQDPDGNASSLGRAGRFPAPGRATVPPEPRGTYLRGDGSNGSARDGDPAHLSPLRPCRRKGKAMSPAHPGRLGGAGLPAGARPHSSAGRSRLCREVSPPGRRAAAAAAAALPPRPLLTCIDVTASPGFPWKHGAAKNSNPPSQPRRGSRQPPASRVALGRRGAAGGLGPEEGEHQGGDSYGGGARTARSQTGSC